VPRRRRSRRVARRRVVDVPARRARHDPRHDRALDPRAAPRARGQAATAARSVACRGSDMISLALLMLTTSTSTPCTGVMDTTTTCASPKREATTIHADAKGDPPPAWQGSIDPEKLPGEFGVIATVLA